MEVNKLTQEINKWDDETGFRVLTLSLCESLSDHLDSAGYRLDPYPNGKSKDDLIKRIEEVEAERDKARNLLREEHDKNICGQNPISQWRHLRELHAKIDPRCPACTFLADTSTVKP